MWKGVDLDSKFFKRRVLRIISLKFYIINVFLTCTPLYSRQFSLRNCSFHHP